MFWKKKKKQRFHGIPDEVQAMLDAFTKGGVTVYLGTGRCPRCGHTRWNVSTAPSPDSLPCPRCADDGVTSTINFMYSQV